MLDFIFGIPFCILGSWGTNMSQIILKMFDNHKAQCEINGDPMPDPILNPWNFGYWGCYLGALGFDLTSQIFLTQIMWCTISALDVFWYNLLSWYWFADVLELIEMCSLSLFISGAILTAVYCPDAVESTRSGFREFTYAWEVSPFLQMLFWGLTLGIMLCVYIYLYRTIQARKQDPQSYPPDYEPEPSSFFNMAGIFVNGVSTALFAVTMYILTNTFFVPEGVTFVFVDLLLAAALFLPFFCLSFGTDWAAASYLHNITQVPSTLMLSTLFQISTNFTLWGISFEQSFTQYMWNFGVVLEILGLFSWVTVQQYVKDRDEAEEAENQNVEQEAAAVSAKDAKEPTAQTI